MDVHRQVFFNYRGEELRYNFISHLIKAFEKHEINFFVDKYEQRGKDLKNLFVRIDESRIALAIFSTRYAESSWCMDELVKMKKLADQRKLQIIPIFYKVSATDVRKQTVEIRSGNGRKPWSVYPTRCSEADFVKEIVKEVKRVITATGLEEEEDIHLEEKGESLRTALSMYDCFSIIVRCWGVDMNQRLSLLEILKRIESFKENVPSDQ
ncbi:protein PHLOEM PROTEIN 2-LIKE A5-like [Brassica rapa]|uniref:protein PHLOEM PROTEIN 2-LIKE A5-like n=1 Tax=Brassica campestris TaxID=3711 RepID=UPI00142D51D6|nr:protein PHLOEM PROTEIN 2-LIKE A5-like [Brassica rapa]